MLYAAIGASYRPEAEWEVLGSGISKEAACRIQTEQCSDNYIVLVVPDRVSKIVRGQKFCRCFVSEKMIVFDDIIGIPVDSLQEI